MNNAIVTMHIGEVKPWMKLSLTTIELYADRCGADVEVIDTVEVADDVSVMYEKLQLDKFFPKYDRVLYLDADILVRPDASNIFTMMDSRGWLYQYREDWLSGRPYFPGGYYNAGVILFPNNAAEITEGWRDVHRFYGPYLEQTFLNEWFESKSTPRCELHSTWNKMDCDERVIDNKDRCKAAFIHYAGAGYQGTTGRPRGENMAMDFKVMYGGVR